MKKGVRGETIEVSMGDVIYIPPHFAHEGTTIEEAMTFSVGFLGPKLSEMLDEYGYYLEQKDQKNTRYSGEDLDTKSAAFAIAPHAQKAIQNQLLGAIQSDDFALFLAEYFSTPRHDDMEVQNEKLSSIEILQHLENGRVLHRPEHMKLSITISEKGKSHLAVYGEIVPASSAHDPLIHWLNKNNRLSIQDLNTLGDRDALITVIADLYNRGALAFAE